MDFNLPEDLVLLQQTVRKFADDEVAPHAADRDRAHEFPLALIRSAANLGLMGASVPEEWGGSSLGNLGGSLITEEVSRVDASLGVALSVHNSLVATPILRFGADDLKRKYLPKLASGEWLGAYALTEAQAGSDAANQATKAEKRGDTYVLNGVKMWITNGAYADVFIVFARTSMEDPTKKHKVIRALVVEKTMPRIRPGKTEHKPGIRASSTTELVLDQCVVPASNVLGEVGKGFSVAMDTLDGGRIGIASQAIGIAQGCLDASLKYAKQRKQFNRPLADFQAIQWKLAEMATGIESARLLVRRAAWLRDRGEPCSVAASMAKMQASVMANRCAEEAVQIHGGAGYTTDFPVERFMRDARITEIYEGTTEIQHLVIAKHVLSAT